MIASDGETPPGTRARAEVLSALIAADGTRAEGSRMRRMHRIVLLAGLLALAPVLAGCENFDMDKSRHFPSQREEEAAGRAQGTVSGGVPGVTQGLPPEYLKGNQPPPDAAQTPDVAGCRGRARATKTRAPAPASKTAAIEPAAEAQAETEAQAEAAHGAAPSTQARSPCSRRPRVKAATSSNRRLGRRTAPQQPAPSAGRHAPWPAAPPPGTFSR